MKAGGVSPELVLICLLFLSPGPAISASFECEKAETDVEKMVCENPDVSALDDELGRIFEVKKLRDRELVGEQRVWLKKVRNACRDLRCVRRAYLERIFKVRGGNSCDGASALIAGHWRGTSAGFFEEMRLSVTKQGHVFASWRHNRPELFGTWAVNECVLKIQNPDANVVLEFSVREISLARLRLAGDDGLVSAYIREDGQ